jgi:hypothetical protein
MSRGSNNGYGKANSGAKRTFQNRNDPGIAYCQ